MESTSVTAAGANVANDEIDGGKSENPRMAAATAATSRAASAAAASAAASAGTSKLNSDASNTTSFLKAGDTVRVHGVHETTLSALNGACVTIVGGAG